MRDQTSRATPRRTTNSRTFSRRWIAGLCALGMSFSLVGCAHLEERHEAHKRLVKNAADHVEEKVGG